MNENLRGVNFIDIRIIIMVIDVLQRVLQIAIDMTTKRVFQIVIAMTTKRRYSGSLLIGCILDISQRVYSNSRLQIQVYLNLCVHMCKVKMLQASPSAKCRKDRVMWIH
jgi:hypothetical protein